MTSTETGTGPTRRGTYRHGDLRHALLEAGIELARRGGPDAVVLREATRWAGVVPNAAYRHFADRLALLRAVSSAAMSALAVGTGYLRFAQAEPGLFRTAFSVPEDLEGAADPAKAGHSGLTPFQLLAAALDELVDAGVLPRRRRPGAEFLAWSAVHGLAMLVIDGPLRGLPPRQTEDITHRLLDMVDQGLEEGGGMTA